MGRLSKEQKEHQKNLVKNIFTLELLKFINNYKHKECELSDIDKMAVMTKIIYKELDK